MGATEDDQHSGRFAIIPSVALDDPGVTPALLKVLCVLGTYGNKSGYCWPKLRTLGSRLKISPQAVSKSLQHLRDLGYIEIKARYGDDGRRIRNDYRILFDVADDTEENGSQVEGHQRPEVEGSQRPEVEGSQRPEVEALNVPSERPIRTLSSAAAISLSTREQVDGGRAPDAAAADWSDNLLAQTAEQIRQRLHMPANKLPGLQDVLRQYPPTHAPRLIAQAVSCEERLKVRPLGITHYANFLIETDNRAAAARQKEANSNGQSNPASEPSTTSLEDRRLAAQRDREKRGAANRKVLELFFPEAAK